MFQFHKVRLKVISHNIGIVIILFQFHKVRLKVKSLNFTRQTALMFQFHKVRLKEEIAEG